ncbi:MAG: hypothetical protein GXO55_04570 [Chloroflexi bacterium]|nr:hypothetical protein [Chloroflexota bacterium]
MAVPTPAVTHVPTSHRPSFLLLLIVLLPLYLLIYGGRFHVIDEVSIYALAESMAKRHALDTDQLLWSQWVRAAREVQGAFGRGGHVYSKKGFGSALLPAFFIHLGLPHLHMGLILLSLLTNPLLTALTAYVLARYIHELGYPHRRAWTLGLVYGVATLALPYTRTLFGEPVAALGTMVALYALRRDRTASHGRWALLAGLGFSLSVWARLINTPAVLFLWWYQRSQNPPPDRVALWRGLLPARWKRGLLFLGTVALLGVGGYALYNMARFGLPWKTGYQLTQGEFFTTPPWVGLYGILLSPFRGLFWFTPLFLASIPGFWALRQSHRSDAYTLLGIVGIYLALFSTWWMWWGGFAWGPRFLLPIVPLLVVPLAPLWDRPRWRWPLRILLALSLLVQFLAVASDFTLSETALELTFGHPERSQALFNPLWSPILLQAKHLWMGFWDVAWVHVGRSAWPLLAGLLALGGLGWALGWAPRRWQQAGVVFGLLLWGGLAWWGIGLVSAHRLARPPDATIAPALTHIREHTHAPAAVVTLAPFDYEPLMNWDHTRFYTLGLAPHPAPLRPEERHLLQHVLQEKTVVWLFAARLPPLHPHAVVEQILSKRAFPFYHQWYGENRLAGFLATPRSEDVLENTMRVEADFEDGIQLVAVTLWGTPRVDEGLRVSLLWKTKARPHKDYTVFLHLLDKGGRLVAGYDAPPQNGYAATSTWQPGQLVEDRKGLLLPAGTPPGTYLLEVGLYDGVTGQRLRTESGDSVRLTVVVRE